MLLRHILDSLVDLHYISLSLLYRGAAVARFSGPSVDIALQLVVFALLLLDIFA